MHLEANRSEGDDYDPRNLPRAQRDLLFNGGGHQHIELKANGEFRMEDSPAPLYCSRVHNVYPCQKDAEYKQWELTPLSRKNHTNREYLWQQQQMSSSSAAGSSDRALHITSPNRAARMSWSSNAKRSKDSGRPVRAWAACAPNSPRRSTSRCRSTRSTSFHVSKRSPGRPPITARTAISSARRPKPI